MSTVSLKGKRIYLMGGPGGVGKTTLAAAMGAKFAEEGYRTVVLTVDPARRLAGALGLDGFSSELQKVTLASGKEFYATMLDTQRYFDKIISKFALSDDQRDKILNHRLYRIMVESLGGTHEYAAMERLLEFVKESDFQKIIVDTPPSQNAADLLSAPERLADFMDNSVLRWFQKRSGPLSLFRQGTKVAMKLLEKIFGAEFLASLSEVFNHLEGMQAGFHQRNKEVVALLQSADTAFFLVSYPSEVRYEESRAFIETLRERRISLAAILLNRVEPTISEPNAGELETLPKETRQKVEAVLDFCHTLREGQEPWIKQFNAFSVPCFTVEREEDLSSLSKLIHFL